MKILKRSIYVVFSILLYLRLVYFKIGDSVDKNFNSFVRDNLHKIFLEDKQLNIEKVILLVCFYLLSFYTFSKVLSVNIDSFKGMIKYKSKGITNFFGKILGFFLKIWLLDTLIFFLITSITYIIITKNYNITDYYLGIIDLLKLPLLLSMVLCIGTFFNIDKMGTFCLIYSSILMYIFFVNYISLYILLVLYIVEIAVIVVRLMVCKLDV